MELKTLEDCFKFLETQKDVNLRWLTSYKKFILTRKENCLQEKHHFQFLEHAANEPPTCH